MRDLFVHRLQSQLFTGGLTQFDRFERHGTMSKTQTSDFVARNFLIQNLGHVVKFVRTM
jgi:hypothetical protein